MYYVTFKEGCCIYCNVTVHSSRLIQPTVLKAESTLTHMGHSFMKGVMHLRTPLYQVFVPKGDSTNIGLTQERLQYMEGRIPERTPRKAS